MRLLMFWLKFGAVIALLVLSGWLYASRSSLPEGARELAWLLAVMLVGLIVLAAHWQAQREAERLAGVGTHGRFVAHGHAGKHLAGSLLLVLLFGFASVVAFHREPPLLLLTVPAAALGVWGLQDLLRTWLKPGPVLRMDANGIVHARLGAIAWADVFGMAVTETRIKGFRLREFVLGVRAPARYLHGMPWGFRLLRANWRRRRPAYGSIGFGLDALDCAPQTVLDAAVELRRHDPAPYLDDWHPSMSSLRIGQHLCLQKARRELADARRSADATLVLERSERLREAEAVVAAARRKDTAKRGSLGSGLSISAWKPGRLYRDP